MTEMLHLDLGDFLKIPDGETFAKGCAPDNSEGLNMLNTGKPLYWIAVKGYAQDWTVYCGWDDDYDFLKRYGDKVRDPINLANVISVSDEVLERYR